MKYNLNEEFIRIINEYANIEELDSRNWRLAKEAIKKYHGEFRSALVSRDKSNVVIEFQIDENIPSKYGWEEIFSGYSNKRFININQKLKDPNKISVFEIPIPNVIGNMKPEGDIIVCRATTQDLIKAFEIILKRESKKTK